MQIYTHLLAGLAIGVVLRPHDPVMQASAALGGLSPDTMVGLQFFVDKLKHRKPFSNEPEGGLWFWLKELSHSPLWFIGFAYLGQNDYLNDLVHMFTWGFFTHWIIDVCTHCGHEFADTDQSLMCPFYELEWCPKIGQVFGFWEYRYDYKDPNNTHGTFDAKHPEKITCAILGGIVILSWLLPPIVRAF